jgi:hypothetical protein
MKLEQVDPTESLKEIAFWGNPVELTQYGNAVTIRKGFEGGDKYDRLQPGDEFDYIIQDGGIKANLGKGLVVAHWKMSYRDIPTEIICGEEFPKEVLYPRFRVRDEMLDVLRNIYGDYNEDTLSHVFVFVYPDEIYENIIDNFDLRYFHQNHDLFFREFLHDEYIQREGETPEEWLKRECSGFYGIKNLGDLFFGINNSYITWKSIKALR